MKHVSIIIRSATAAIAITAMAGCGIYSKYETPTASSLTREYAQARSMGADSSAIGNTRWEDFFTDPILDSLISTALSNNTNLRNAQLNVEIAQANLKGAQLSYLPSLSLAPNVGAASYGGSELRPTYQVPLQMSWEADIFGKLLNSKRSARQALLQSEAYAQAVRSQIIAAVATNYYAIAAVDARIQLATNTAALWKQTVQTMRELKEAGRGVTEAAVVQSAANYHGVLASIEDLRASRAELYSSMSTLLNTTPRRWEVNTDMALLTPAYSVDTIPISHLAARPDVAAAEHSLAMAFYATNSARAAFYPGLNITATGGFTNLLGSVIKNPGDMFYQLGASLAAPIFSRGRNMAALKGAKARQQQALNNFEYSILNAAAEVSNALSALESNELKLTHLDAQVAELTKAVDYTQELMLYSTGSTSYLEVLTAQQNLLSAQNNRIAAQLARARAIIALYQALGGGR